DGIIDRFAVYQSSNTSVEPRLSTVVSRSRRSDMSARPMRVSSSSSRRTAASKSAASPKASSTAPPIPVIRLGKSFLCGERRSNWTGARMSIEIHCDNCQKRYRVKADLAGKRVRCANCGNPVTVPGGGGNNGGADEQLISELPSQNPGSKKPAPPKAPPPPVPRQVLTFH